MKNCDTCKHADGIHCTHKRSYYCDDFSLWCGVGERDIDLLFQHGNQAQREKLEQYEHKEDWMDLPITTLYAFIMGELEELQHEIAVFDIMDNPDNLADIRKECADIANYAHMIIQRCDSEL